MSPVMQVISSETRLSGYRMFTSQVSSLLKTLSTMILDTIQILTTAT